MGGCCTNLVTLSLEIQLPVATRKDERDDYMQRRRGYTETAR